MTCGRLKTLQFSLCGSEVTVLRCVTQLWESASSLGPALKEQKLGASRDLVAEREAEAAQKRQQWLP